MGVRPPAHRSMGRLWRRALSLVFAPVLVLPLLVLPGGAPVASSAAQSVSLAGWLTVVWPDAPPGSRATRDLIYLLADGRGRTTRILLAEEVARPLGGTLALNGRRVVIDGQWAGMTTQQLGPPVLRAASVRLAPSLSTHDGASVANTAQSGAKRWVTILCKFADIADEPAPLTYFQGLLDGKYPGLDHYWRELSYGNVNVGGSTTAGWYTLPQPRAHYVYTLYMDGMPTQPVFDLGQATSDCTAAADADVNFPAFDGVNLAFNSDLDGYAYGGRYVIARDGTARPYSVTWLPPWGYEHQAVLAHEMGHGFGLPHSSGPYGKVYDNQWDVMSDTWSNCFRDNGNRDPAYGCLGQHTIAYHEDLLGWIPADRKYTATSGTRATVELEQLALPPAGSYLMAQIPIGGSATRFYTVEARRRVGYDTQLPGQAVIIHEVDTARREPAHVVDADGNGQTGDGGAMWLPGEAFGDAANGVTVCVNSATATGFVVTIGLGLPTDCSPQPDFSQTTLQASPPSPRRGQRVTFTTHLLNSGPPARGVVATVTLPNDTTYVPASASSTQGAVAEGSALVFGVGTLATGRPVTLAYSVMVSPDLVSAKALKELVTITWEGGSLSKTQSVIVNGSPAYLPFVSR